MDERCDERKVLHEGECGTGGLKRDERGVAKPGRSERVIRACEAIGGDDFHRGGEEAEVEVHGRAGGVGEQHGDEFVNLGKRSVGGAD